LRSSRAGEPWRHGTSVEATTRRNGLAVNAPRKRCGDASTAAREGKASKGRRHRERPGRDLRIVATKVERAGNMANPTAGCRVQQTCAMPRVACPGHSLRRKPLKPGGTARTERERVMADLLRGARFGTLWSGRSGMSPGEGDIDEPQERSRSRTVIERAPDEDDGRNWRESPKRRRQDGSERGTEARRGRPTNRRDNVWYGASRLRSRTRS
jgi:hypothetical protein